MRKKTKYGNLESILKRLIDKGGVYGMCAEMYYDDKSMSAKFILECYEHCHIKSVKENWGDELVNDIKEYKIKYL